MGRSGGLREPKCQNISYKIKFLLTVWCLVGIFRGWIDVRFSNRGIFYSENLGCRRSIGVATLKTGIRVLFLAIAQDTWWHEHFSPLGLLMMCSWSTRFFSGLATALLQQLGSTNPLRCVAPDYICTRIPVFKIMRICYGTLIDFDLMMLLRNRDLC